MPSFDFRHLHHGPTMELRQDLTRILQAALDAVDPRLAVKRFLRLEGSILDLGGQQMALEELGRIRVIGFGKAANPMAAAVEEVLGARIQSGRIHIKDDHHIHDLRRIVESEGSHPYPDERNMEAARAILAQAEGLSDRDLVLCLVSGGGSALLCLPADGLELEDKLECTRCLLACGAPISEVNTVRRHLSAVKGGQLARAFAPARMVTLILSDVLGDPLEAIASGPTVGDPTSHGDALEVLKRRGLSERVPPRVLEHLRRGSRGELPDTPGVEDPLFRRVRNVVVANNASAVAAAARRAEELGFETRILSRSLEGEARELSRLFVTRAREAAKHRPPGAPPLLLLGGGETTVTLEGDGKGGRNQEFALGALIEGMAGLPGGVAVGFASDGTDGPTDAGGAFADEGSLQRALAAGLDPQDFLRRNDAYPFFEKTGDLIRIGATGTNVCDLYMIALPGR